MVLEGASEQGSARGGEVKTGERSLTSPVEVYKYLLLTEALEYKNRAPRRGLELAVRAGYVSGNPLELMTGTAPEIISHDPDLLRVASLAAKADPHLRRLIWATLNRGNPEAAAGELLDTLAREHPEVDSFWVRWKNHENRISLLRDIRWEENLDPEVWLEVIRRSGEPILYHVVRAGVRPPWNVLTALVGGHVAGVGVKSNGLNVIREGRLLPTAALKGNEYFSRVASILKQGAGDVWKRSLLPGANYPFVLDKWGIHFSGDVPLFNYGGEYPVIVISTPTTAAGRDKGVWVSKYSFPDVAQGVHNDIVFLSKSGALGLDSLMVVMPEDYKVGPNDSLFMTNDQGRVLLRDNWKQLLKMLEEGKHSQVKEILSDEGYPEWIIDRSLDVHRKKGPSQPADTLAKQLPILWKIWPQEKLEPLRRKLASVAVQRRILWVETYGGDPWKSVRQSLENWWLIGKRPEIPSEAYREAHILVYPDEIPSDIIKGIKSDPRYQALQRLLTAT